MITAIRGIKGLNATVIPPIFRVSPFIRLIPQFLSVSAVRVGIMTPLSIRGKMLIKSQQDSKTAVDGEMGILARRRIEAAVIAPVYEKKCATPWPGRAQAIPATARHPASSTPLSCSNCHLPQLSQVITNLYMKGYRG
jgi:hypothetical protein